MKPELENVALEKFKMLAFCVIVLVFINKNTGCQHLGAVLGLGWAAFERKRVFQTPFLSIVAQPQSLDQLKRICTKKMQLRKCVQVS